MEFVCIHHLRKDIAAYGNFKSENVEGVMKEERIEFCLISS